MIETTADLSPEALALYDDVVDVRSPAEFAADRIPGAINLPVLDDAERAEVGTIYAQESRFRARRIGAAYVARNVAGHLEGPLAGKPSGYRPLLYCWRGGMRSNSMATILSQIGWRVGVLEGGYRTWRRAVTQELRDSTAPLPLVLLDGQTGAAKSLILAELRRLGVQTLDLEALAAHRGSVFGATASVQPSQKQFETLLYDALRRLDVSAPIVVEAESAAIGAVEAPPRLWKAMQSSPCIEIAAPLAARARHLVSAYADLVEDSAKLLAMIGRLAPFHSRETIEAWIAMAEAGSHAALAEGLMAEHYDPRYNRARQRRARPPLAVIRTETLDGAAVADAARAIAGVLSTRCAPQETVLSDRGI